MRPFSGLLRFLCFLLSKSKHGHQTRGAVRWIIRANGVLLSAAVVGTQPAENAEYIRGFLDTVKAQIAEARSLLADETFAIIDKVHLPAAGEETYERGYTRCPMAECLTVIAADQCVYTCQDKAYTTSGLLGSIKDQSFAALWASDELARRLRALDPSRQCRHHCVAHAKNLSLLEYFEADEEHLDFV